MSERHLKVKMVHSIRKRRKTIGEQTIFEEGGTQSTTGANLKLDNMAWINYHKQQCQITNPEGKKKSMNEIRVTWNNLSREEKLQYTMPKKNDVDEKVHVGDTHNDNDVQPFDTRCTPTRFSQMVSTFSDLQKDAVRELGFGNLLMLKCGFLRRELCAWVVNKFDTTTLSVELHGKSFKLDPSIFSHVMGISDRGDTICIDGAIPDIWKTKFSITNRGIKLLHLEGLLKNNKTCDDDFKVTFCLHMLGTILAPAAGEYVDARYLSVLADVGNIKGKNWAKWCFDQLVISIKKFQSKSARYIGGCVLFLELFYLHVIDWQPPIVDKLSIPIVSWTTQHKKKCLKHLREQGSNGVAKVSINEYTPLVAPSDNSNKAKHDISNDDMFHMVLKEIQQLRKEHVDLKHKVDSLYETIIVNKDEEVARLKEKVDILYGKINHPYGTKPKDTSDHKKEQHTPPPNFPSMETDVSPPAQRHIVEVSSKDSPMKSQYLMGKHNPTPSWENESVPTAKDCALDDDYLPEHKTIPRLINEEKRTIIAKGYEEQSSSSMNVVKKTRTLKIRKPSQYKLSPYLPDHRLRKPSMFRYGPFRLSVSLNALDAQIIEYVYSEDLPPSETIVSTSRILVNRNSFRTLEPTMWVDSEIISLVADNNTHIATRKRSSLYWYLPTQFAYLSLTSKDGNMKKLTEIHSTFKHDYMYDLHRCEMMISLDNVLTTEIKSCFGPSFSFQSFNLVSPEDCPTQPNFYDCGIFVCMFIDERSHATTRKFQNTFNSVAERLFLARQLATFPTNQILGQLKKNAIEYSDMQIGKLPTIGKKRQAPPLKKDSRAKMVKTLS